MAYQEPQEPRQRAWKSLGVLGCTLGVLPLGLGAPLKEACGDVGPCVFGVQPCGYDLGPYDR